MAILLNWMVSGGNVALCYRVLLVCTVGIFIKQTHLYTCRKAEDKNYHVMRFKPPHKCDLEKLINVSPV